MSEIRVAAMTIDNSQALAAVDQLKRNMDGVPSSASKMAGAIDQAGVAANRNVSPLDKLNAGMKAAADHGQQLSSKLEFTAKMMSAAGLAFDSVGWVPASTGAAQLSGRVLEVGEAIGIVASGAGALTNAFGQQTEATNKTAAAHQELAKAQQGVLQSVESVGQAMEDAIPSWVTAGIAAAGLTALAGGTMYAVYKLHQEMLAGVAAIQAWEQKLVGADVAEHFTPSAIAAAAAVANLSRELGVSASAMAPLAGVAKDYGVSTDLATASARRMIDVLDQTNTATGNARQVMEDYGVSVKDATGDQWSQKLDEFAQKLNMVRDSGQKTRDIMTVFGSTGVQMLAGIASGAGDTSHAITQVQQNATALDQIIAASQARIAATDQRTWYEKLYDDINKALSRSEEFKSEQALAAGEAVVAWREYQAGVGTLSTQWANAKKAVEDYIQVVAHGIAPGTFAAPDLPQPTNDNRPDSPTIKAEQDRQFRAQLDAWNKQADNMGTTDTTVQDAQTQLDKLKLQKENWYSWNLTREAQYWKDLKAQITKEWGANGEDMSPDQQAQQMAADPNLQAINAKIATAEQGAGQQAQADADAQAQAYQAQVEAGQKLVDNVNLQADAQSRLNAAFDQGTKALTAAEIANAVAAVQAQNQTVDVDALTAALQRKADADQAAADQKTAAETTAAYDTYLQKMKDETDLAQRQLDLAEQTKGMRTGEVEALKLRLDIERQFPDLDATRKQALFDQADAEGNMKGQVQDVTKAFQDQQRQIQQLGDNIQRDLAHGLETAFKGGGDAWDKMIKGWHSALDSFLANMIAQFAETQFVIPIAAEVIGGGSSTGKAAAGSGSGVLGNLFNLGSTANSVSGFFGGPTVASSLGITGSDGALAGITSGINAWGAETLGGTFAPTAVAEASTAAELGSASAANAAGGTAFTTSAATPLVSTAGGGLAVIGGSYMAGNMIGSAVGTGGGGAAAGAAGGAATGALIGSYFGGVGAIPGAIIGLPIGGIKGTLCGKAIA